MKIKYPRTYHLEWSEGKGFVIRLSSEFLLDDFQKSVVKWVRKGHVQTDEHWMNKIIVPNELMIK